MGRERPRAEEGKREYCTSWHGASSPSRPGCPGSPFSPLKPRNPCVTEMELGVLLGHRLQVPALYPSAGGSGLGREGRPPFPLLWHLGLLEDQCLSLSVCVCVCVCVEGGMGVGPELSTCGCSCIYLLMM